MDRPWKSATALQLPNGTHMTWRASSSFSLSKLTGQLARDWTETWDNHRGLDTLSTQPWLPRSWGRAQQRQYWYWLKASYGQQWSRIESPETNSYIYGQLIFHRSQDSLVGEGKSCQQVVQKNKVGLLFHTIYRWTKRWNKGINVKAKTIKLLEEDIRKHLHELSS